MKPRKINPNSLANLDPANRSQGKQRFNVTLRPETIAWLQQTGNASQRIEEMVAEAKAQERLKEAQDTIQSLEGVIERWRQEINPKRANSPRWEKVAKLLDELKNE